MQTLKEEAIQAISSIPEPVDIDDIMYRFYVLDKIRKGREAAEKGDSITIDALKEEMEKW
ncbi:hypothetical protein [Desulfatirhabdium butyrativorans]|uniref:hypothetical protein n=1 Tax=Desulfatirhabdium butyrativorans TaxID=340467 RepID=UPI000414DA06|nr:hypothetical protein [Desulfatirhabdium butyrativorans]